MIIRAFLTFLLIFPVGTLAAHEMDRYERDSGKYVSKVKVRDYYVTPEGEQASSSEKVYSRSTITFKYDGSVYTVEFAKKELDNRIAKNKVTWQPSWRWVN